jgi:hypothetical protein
MNIKKATQKYEACIGRWLRIVKPDLELKHRVMAADSFRFLRATFYRWCQLWPKVCAAEARAPMVLAVGDLHVENFGTWRDIEGRLVWGVNDFDEACPGPYTIDLVRLATSAHFAIALEHLTIGPKDACQSIVEGYQTALRAGGTPVVLGESHHWLRTLAMSELRDPARYWERMDALPTFKGRVPKSAIRALEELMPEKVSIPSRSPRSRLGQPGKGEVRCVGRLARREDCERSESIGAFGLPVGAEERQHQEHSIRKSVDEIGSLA